MVDAMDVMSAVGKALNLAEKMALKKVDKKE